MINLLKLIKINGFIMELGRVDKVIVRLFALKRERTKEEAKHQTVMSQHE